ncbi:MAG: NUDIX domain-containing protein [Kiritimatiellae bacterium]|nr:NUDIX domain-containing protein [Kiritimatiellia bacterium]
MSKKRHIEVLARGVCVKRNRLLLCHSKGARNTFLPGGHVEFREPARECLRREIAEEIGLAARIGRFLGAVEHAFRQKGEPHAEINLLFAMTIAQLDPRKPPPAMEKKIEFLWVPLAELAGSRLEPSVLRTVLPDWLRESGDTERWGSMQDLRH